MPNNICFGLNDSGGGCLSRNPLDINMGAKTIFNATNISVTNWFKGKFNFTVTSLSKYINVSFDGNNIDIDFNETELNNTIDARSSNAAGIWTNVTKVNQPLGMASFNGNFNVSDGTIETRTENGVFYVRKYVT